MENPTLLLILTTTLLAGTITAESSLNLIGVNYGTQGDNLPPASEAVGLYKRVNVASARLFEPVPAALEAMRGSGIKVSLGIRNEQLPAMASDPTAVNAWIAANVEPYANDVVFNYVTVGSEVIPGELGRYVLPVMQSVQAALTARGWSGVKVTTVVPANVLSVSYPPSAGQFSAQAAEDMRGVIRFLSSMGSPLMINVYPYFAYASDPANVRLDYAQFTAIGAVVQDGGLSYSNLFDAVVDSFVWAMEKEGVADVDIVVSETGWPSAGNGPYTTPELASTYVRNLVSHIEAHPGTPKRPGAFIEAYIFALFNENLKPAGVEQNFGLFYPNMTPVYPLFNIDRWIDREIDLS